MPPKTSAALASISCRRLRTSRKSGRSRPFQSRSEKITPGARQSPPSSSLQSSQASATTPPASWTTARQGLYSMLKISSPTPPASSRMRLEAPPDLSW